MNVQQTLIAYLGCSDFHSVLSVSSFPHHGWGGQKLVVEVVSITLIGTILVKHRKQLAQFHHHEPDTSGGKAE